MSDEVNVNDPHDDPNKNTDPSPPREVSDLVVPDLDDVPEDDKAEKSNAGIDHEATEEEVDEALPDDETTEEDAEDA